MNKDGCAPLAVEASRSSVQTFATLLIQQQVARLHHDFISSVAKEMSLLLDEPHERALYIFA